MPSQPSSETQEFNRNVQFLLKPNNPHARSLLAFIKRTIHQFGLQAYITEIDIFAEAYLRGVKYTQQNQEHIRQPKAWIRRTAYNIIRECKRDRLRYSAVAFDELMEQPSGEASGTSLGAIDDGAIANSINAVRQALDALSPGDRNLIQWKVVEGLTWQQVQARCVTEGEDRVSQATLRKRGQRALERLRRAYHIFNGEPGAPELEDILADHPDSEVVQRDRSIPAPPIAPHDPAGSEVVRDCSESFSIGQGAEVPEERSTLYDFLVNLPAAQFRAVVIEVNLPRGNLPPLDASPWEQVACLFDWVESSLGPGLESLRSAIVNVLNRS